MLQGWIKLSRIGSVICRYLEFLKTYPCDLDVKSLLFIYLLLFTPVLHAFCHHTQNLADVNATWSDCALIRSYI